MEPLVQSIVRRSENSKWLSANYSKLAQKYNNQWVAVYDGRVIAHGKSLAEISRKLRSEYKDAYGEIAFEYVTKKPVQLIL